MVRTLTEHVRFPSHTPERIFSLLFESDVFFSTYYGARGDADVLVVPWTEQQRLCAYAMVERDSEGNERDKTRCLETQSYRKLDDSYQIDARVQPDGAAVGNLFVVHFSYQIRPLGDGQGATVLVDVTIECLKSVMWGFSSVVEGIVEGQVKSALALWIQMASECVDGESESESSDDRVPVVGVRPADQPLVMSGSSKKRLRRRDRERRKKERDEREAARWSAQMPHQRLSTMKHVARGTESIVRLLTRNPRAYAGKHPSDDDVRTDQAVLDGADSMRLIQLGVLEEGLGKVKRRESRSDGCARVWMFAGVAFILVLVLWLWPFVST